jgi:putative SOS response-associated peptidase YedK
MCGRFTRDYTWEQVHAFLQPLTVGRPESNLQPSYNVCPTDTIDAVLPAGEFKVRLEPMRWGLVPAWWKKPLREFKLATFNARADSVTDKPIFRSAWKRNRCIVPASGYFEWHTEPDGKQPHYFTRRDGQLIGIAGIWDEWKDIETGESLRSCAMIITEANSFVSSLHDRMPVILERDQFADWLSAKSGIEALKPAADDVLRERPVSRRVNSNRADKLDRTLIEELP